MWIHDHRLPELLRADQYCSAEQHELELARIFRPAWHCVGVTDDLPVHGSFVTQDLFGTPVIVRNEEGRIVAFRNVCAHRHSLLTHEARGCMKQLRCQYHGWEYDPDGVVCKVPDGASFKPFRRAEFTLTPLRVATCGRLLFVSLAGDGPSLAESLGGETYEHYASCFPRGMRMIGAWSQDYDCNWKILIENTLETYHLASVHGTTFKEMPTKEHLTNRCEDRFVAYQDTTPEPRLMALVKRGLRREIPVRFEQHHAFPATTVFRSALGDHLQSVFPVTPTTCRSFQRLYLAYGVDGSLPRRLLAGLLRRPSIWFSKTVMKEDLDVVRDIQKGTVASLGPGVIGAREERVHGFQRYVQRMCA